MSDIKIGRMVLGIYSTNCYFLYRDTEGDKEAIVFDAPDQGAQIVAALKKHGIRVAALMLTHGHFDHILGASELRSASSAKIYALDKEQPVLEDSTINMSAQMRRPATVKVNKYLADGEEIEIAGITLKVIATPGHTVGSCCYYCKEANMCISGDTIFYESVGRSDFPTGDGAELERSATEKLFLLPDDTKVYPGHGEDTTIGHEKKYNPFLV